MREVEFVELVLKLLDFGFGFVHELVHFDLVDLHRVIHFVRGFTIAGRLVKNAVLGVERVEQGDKLN